MISWLFEMSRPTISLENVVINILIGEKLASLKWELDKSKWKLKIWLLYEFDKLLMICSNGYV
mgnify:CR=1 FL=1